VLSDEALRDLRRALPDAQIIRRIRPTLTPPGPGATMKGGSTDD
jgi:hypothetical protein